jgi:hypothetical protein
MGYKNSIPIWLQRDLQKKTLEVTQMFQDLLPGYVSHRSKTHYRIVVSGRKVLRMVFLLMICGHNTLINCSHFNYWASGIYI